MGGRAAGQMVKHKGVSVPPNVAFYTPDAPSILGDVHNPAGPLLGVMVGDDVTRPYDLCRRSEWAPYSGTSYRQRCLDIAWVAESSAGMAVLTWNLLDSSRRVPWLGPVTLTVRRTFLIRFEFKLKSAGFVVLFQF